MNVNSHFKKIYFLGKAIAVQLKEWFLELPRYKQIVAVVGTLSIIVIAVRILPTATKTDEGEVQTKQVVVATIADLSNNTQPVPLVGSVTSVNEAVVRAESSGRLTKVYKKLGDYVSAGSVIGEFENSLERAAVLQAQGAYESAKAGRDISLINSANTNVSIEDTKNNTLNTINSAYTTIDDLIRSKTDLAFYDPRTINPKFKLLVPDSILVSKIENERIQMEALLTARETKNRILTTDSDLIKELNDLQTDLQKVRVYFDYLGTAYVKAIPNDSATQATIDGQKAVVGGARASVSGTISSITQAKISLQNSLASKEIAGRTTGDSNPNTASADASVKSALGAYQAALARLEKTVLRSPINGTLNSLTIQTGDFVNQTAQVAVVSNNGALEIVAYVTAEDSKRVTVGSQVKINSTIKGVVTRVAGAVDPVTKKIEVRVGIVDKEANLINGQSVRLEIGAIENNSSVSAPQAITMIKVPLSAVKITPRGSYVFTLSASSTLQSVTVETGTLLGEEVQIVSGLIPEMSIVKDVRGLKEGEVVEVK